jgi:hypothetical protein
MNKEELETEFVNTMYEHITASEELMKEVIWDYLWQTAESMDEDTLRRAVEGGQP